MSRLSFSCWFSLSLAVAGSTLVGCAGRADDPAAPMTTEENIGLPEAPRGDRAKAISPVARYTEGLLRQPVTGRAKLTLVFVLDGMRPDLFNPTDTPNMYRLREQGVNFVNGHAVFPTVTRVNSPSIATGMYPGRAGVIGNSIFIPEIDPTGDLNTGDWRVLTELDSVTGGQLLFVDSLAERLHAAGKMLAAVSSGSSGSAYLLNHRADQGVGVLVSGYLEDGNGRVAFPDSVDVAIRSRFAVPPPKAGPGGGLEAVNWTEDVLRDYVLPDLRPTVVLNWFTQPDGVHHSFGTGSPEGIAGIRNDDRNVGLILDKLRELGLEDQTNIFVVSDHGFGLDGFQVNLEQSLIDAGLKQGAGSEDVVLASSSHVAAIHVKGRSPRKIFDIVRHLQAQDFTGVVFTRPRPHRFGFGADPVVEGWVPGTFSIDLVHLDNDIRGADIFVTFDWSSAKNAFGIPGTDTTLTSGTTGPRTGNASGHGSMSPWNVRNTWFAWGPDFKDGIVNRVPSSNVDIAPTILALNGLDASELDGRVLVEALEGGPDYEKLPLETKTFITDTSGYRALIQVTEVGHQRYIDKSWRLP
jgi:predicted AlkP superfamily pyrophosphatase or phosphodiesterase